jgi:PAS domain S-box-containing protein
MKLINILLLEDNLFDAELIGLEFARSNLPHRITRIDTQSAFVEAIRHTHFDIILSDYNLPDFDGMTALQLTQEISPETPFIIVTGSLSEETAADSIRRGAWDYVVKQRLFRLNGAIQNALEYKQQVSQKKLMERELVRSEERYRTLIEAAAQPIMMLSKTGIVLFLNAEAAAFHQQPRELLIGKSLWDLFPASQADLLLESINKAISQESLVDFLEKLPFHATERWISARITPVSMGEGKADSVLIIANDITRLKDIETNLKQALNEKNVLLREVHHRVKNNMQIISSLISMQSRYTTIAEAKQLFKESETRIRSMLLIHEMLYETNDLSRVEMHEYVAQMVRFIQINYDVQKPRFTVKNNVDDIMLNINTAIPCGLIINELVTNSVLHGFPDDTSGSISVCFSVLADKRYRLKVEDTGVGLPDTFSVEKPSSLGMMLVNALTNQLNAQLEITKAHPTSFTFTFSEPNLKTFHEV